MEEVEERDVETMGRSLFLVFVFLEGEFDERTIGSIEVDFQWYSR